MRQMMGRLASIAILSLLSYSASSGLHIVERMNAGVHVCTTAHYDHSRVACSADDSVLSSLAAAKVVAFGPRGSTFTADAVVFHVQQKGSRHACTTDPFGANDSVRSLSMKVDELFSTCHIRPASGTTWGVTAIQPDKVLGSTAFTYQPR
jgi:hypothetical protein